MLSVSCNQSRNDNKDHSGYEVVKSKSYVIRNSKVLTGDSTGAIVLQKQEEMISVLERNGFKRHNALKDSLIFRRSNGQEVLIELPAPQDSWQAGTIIAFDPQKNPLFINLKKDTTQVSNYLK